HTRFSRDWSSDVCSSDLVAAIVEGDSGDDGILDVWALGTDGTLQRVWRDAATETWRIEPMAPVAGGGAGFAAGQVALHVADLDKIGRASCREKKAIAEAS